MIEVLGYERALRSPEPMRVHETGVEVNAPMDPNETPTLSLAKSLVRSFVLILSALIAGSVNAQSVVSEISGSDTSTISAPINYGKPNLSRAWYNSHAMRWDALVPKNDGGGSASDHYILKDVPGSQTFTSVELEDRNSARPDVFWDDGNKTLYVLGSHFATSEFWRIAYDASQDTYDFKIGAVGAGELVPGITHPNTSNGADSPASVYATRNGAVWAAAMKTGPGLEVQHSADGGVTWMASPLTLDAAAGVGVTTWIDFENDGTRYVGVFAGENGEGAGSTTRFFFWYIDQDADPSNPANWIDDSSNIPVPGGPGSAAASDDHVSAARDAAGNQYFAVKTEGGNDTDPLINLYKRTPDGAWSQFKATETQEDPEESRPSLVIDDENEELYIYTNGVSFVEREASRVSARLDSLGDLASAPFVPVFSAAGTIFADVITPRDNVDSTTGVVVLAHNRTENTVWFAADAIVPDVVGLPKEAAEAAILAANFDLVVGSVTTANSDTVPAGAVISQDPAAGTFVAPSSPVDLVISSGPATVSIEIMSLHPVADAFVSEDKPNENKGSDDRLKIKVEAGKEQVSYLRFDAGALSGSVLKATLYLFARKDSNGGFDLYAVDDNGWGEGSITYSNAPAFGAFLGHSGPTRTDEWIAIDVTRLVTGPGQFSLALVETGDENEFFSREKNEAPLLVIETVADSLAPLPALLDAPTFNPVADAFVSEDKPNENKGSDDRLKIKAEAGKEQISYLRFDAGALSGSVFKATLYLFAKKDSNGGFDLYAVDDNGWGEDSITYANAPPVGAFIGTSGPTRRDTWTAIDVTRLVTGSGQFSLALIEIGRENEFVSREKNEAPLLVVETVAEPLTPLPALLDARTFNPLADAFVEEDHPDDNKGSDDRLKIKAEAGKQRISYLRFDPGALSGNLSKATLYLFAKKDSNARFDVYAVDDNGWGEDSITYATAPPLGRLIGHGGPTANDTWTAIDVTLVVSGSNAFSLALVETANENEFVSREKDQAPLLVVETD